MSSIKANILWISKNHLDQAYGQKVSQNKSKMVIFEQFWASFGVVAENCDFLLLFFIFKLRFRNNEKELGDASPALESSNLVIKGSIHQMDKK